MIRAELGQNRCPLPGTAKKVDKVFYLESYCWQAAQQINKFDQHVVRMYVSRVWQFFSPKINLVRADKKAG